MPEATPRAAALTAALTRFLDEEILPAEAEHAAQAREVGSAQPPIVEHLKRRARALGLWNLFLPHAVPGHEPLTNHEYAGLAELSGRSPFLAPEVMNCAAPDTGNMELLAMFGTAEQREAWLRPLLDGSIRSAYAMTEPDVASSDAGNIGMRIERSGNEWVVTGRKWWITGVGRERCRLVIALGVTDADADRHRRHSMVLVPRDAPGVTVHRTLSVFGHDPFETHVEMTFDDVRLPAANLLGERGAGFAMAQARLGPGRIHHCMRMIGTAERALEAMVARAGERTTFGRRLRDQGVVQEWIADSRIEIDQARQYILHAAHLMDTVGNRAAMGEISGIKVVAPSVAARVLDRAIQLHGAAGLSDDFPLARMWVEARTLRLADGPDEVHRRAVARAELARHDRARSA